MDLISRKTAIETLALNTDYQTPEGIKNDLINHPGKECDWLGGIDEAISIIEELPSIAAVPLDKLCELCEETGARVPCVICEKIMPEWCTQHNKPTLTGRDWWDCPAWKQILTKWMEEQDAIG